MTSTEKRRMRLIAVIAEILEVEVPVVRGELRLREDLGMDSLGSLELLSTISEELRIDLEMEHALELRTVDDACHFVERQYLEQHEAARVQP